MADLRIADAPEIDESEVQGGLKIPTGGFGNKAINMNTVASWVVKDKDLPSKDYVDDKFNQGNQGLAGHVANKNNPHEVTKEQVGLGNVDNTADADKPISNATSAALNLKADKSNTYTKTEVDGVVDDLYQSLEDNFVSNGAALPYDPQVTYNDGAIVVDNGVLKKVESGTLVNAIDAESVSLGDSTLQEYTKRLNLKVKKTITVSEYGIVGDGANEGVKLALMFSENQEKGTRFDFQGLTVASDRIHLFDQRNKFELFNGALLSIGDTGNVTFRDCKNYKTTDFIFDGNRDNQTPAESPSKHNVKIYGGENFEFSNVSIINGMCENLYIGTSPSGELPKKGYFYGLNLKNSYRNNLGIIDGADIFFDNYCFEDANGISPQAGIDLESNDRTGANTIRNIRFGRGEVKGNMGHQVLLTQYGVPRDIDLGQMIISAPRNSLGGIFAVVKNLNLSGVIFKDFMGEDSEGTNNDTAQFCVRLGLPETFVYLDHCRFENMADNVKGVRSHSSVLATRSLGYIMSKCEFDNVGNNFMQPNCQINVHEKPLVRSCRGTWLVGDNVDNRHIEVDGGFLLNCAGRAVNSQAAGFIFKNVTVQDCLTTNGWVQITGAMSEVEDNKFIASSQLGSSIRALTVNSSIKTLRSNSVNSNFTSTSAIYNADAGTTRNVGLVNENNIIPASVSDGINIIRSPKTIAKFTTATRPLATAVPSGAEIYDTTIQSLLVSNGVVWLLPSGVKAIKQTEVWTPTELAVNEIKSYVFTVNEVVLGDSVSVSADKNLQGTRIWAEVTAANTVTVYHQNPTVSSVTVAAGSLFIKLV